MSGALEHNTRINREASGLYWWSCSCGAAARRDWWLLWVAREQAINHWRRAR